VFVKILGWEEFIGADLGDGFPGTAMTVGVFDGVHTGHQELIRRVVERDRSLRPTVLTFKNNPKAIMRPDDFEGDICSLDQKIEILGARGIGLVVLIDFSGDFGKMSGREFIDLLLDRGKLRYLAVGNDFRCGYRLDTDADAIRAFTAACGVVSDIVAPVNYQGAPVSSSRIRAAIATGNLVEVSALLGRNYVFDLSPVALPRGEDSSDTVVREPRRIMPPDGRYQVRLKRKMDSDGLLCVARIQNRRIEFTDSLDGARFMEFVSGPLDL
jgi:FAD synthase